MNERRIDRSSTDYRQVIDVIQEMDSSSWKETLKDIEMMIKSRDRMDFPYRTKSPEEWMGINIEDTMNPRMNQSHRTPTR